MPLDPTLFTSSEHAWDPMAFLSGVHSSYRCHPKLCRNTEGLPFGRFSLDKWVTLAGTFLADEVVDGEVYVQAWVDGNYTGTFYLADVRFVQLNTALLNVIRTNMHGALPRTIDSLPRTMDSIISTSFNTTLLRLICGVTKHFC
jgi:hypothetical protein